MPPFPQAPPARRGPRSTNWHGTGPAWCPPAQALAHIANIIPIIELPNLVLDPTEPLNGPAIAAINVGARLGVMGKPIPAEAGHLDTLATMMVVMKDEADNSGPGGKELGRGPGAAILGHPLNAAILLAQDLAKATASCALATCRASAPSPRWCRPSPACRRVTCEGASGDLGARRSGPRR